MEGRLAFRKLSSLEVLLPAGSSNGLFSPTFRRSWYPAAARAVRAFPKFKLKDTTGLRLRVRQMSPFGLACELYSISSDPEAIASNQVRDSMSSEATLICLHRGRLDM